MKKLLSLLVLSIYIAFSLIGVAQAANTYKVYNKNENKTYYLPLGTVRFIADGYYIFALFKDNRPYCVLDKTLNVKNQLIGGQCTEYNAAMRYYNSNGNFDISNYEYGFREVKSDTFLNEARTIRENKSRQGFVLATDRAHQLENIEY